MTAGQSWIKMGCSNYHLKSSLIEANPQLHHVLNWRPRLLSFLKCILWDASTLLTTDGGMRDGVKKKRLFGRVASHLWNSLPLEPIWETYHQGLKMFVYDGLQWFWTLWTVIIYNTFAMVGKDWGRHFVHCDPLANYFADAITHIYYDSDSTLIVITQCCYLEFFSTL